MNPEPIENLDDLIGLSGEEANRLLQSREENYRIIEKGTMMTMELIPGRVTVNLDEDGNVSRVSRE